MSVIEIKVDTENLKNGMGEFKERMLVALGIYSETAAKKFEGYAREHRQWTDRTARARQGLTGYTEKTKEGFKINIAHTVDYGLWLELAHEKKYAILEPTVRLVGPEIVSGLKTLLS